MVLLTLILTGNISLHHDLCFGFLGIKEMSSLFSVFLPRVRAQVFGRDGIWDQDDDWLDEFWGLLYVTQKDAKELVLSQTSEQ